MHNFTTLGKPLRNKIKGMRKKKERKIIVHEEVEPVDLIPRLFLGMS
jgi:hypothetical protein